MSKPSRRKPVDILSPTFLLAGKQPIGEESAAKRMLAFDALRDLAERGALLTEINAAGEGYTVHLFSFLLCSQLMAESRDIPDLRRAALSAQQGFIAASARHAAAGGEAPALSFLRPELDAIHGAAHLLAAYLPLVCVRDWAIAADKVAMLWIAHRRAGAGGLPQIHAPKKLVKAAA